MVTGGKGMHLYKQRGSFMGWFLVVAVILGIASIVVRLAPYYIDHGTMRSILEEMVADDRIAGESSAEFKRTFIKRLELNNIREFEVDDALAVEAKSGTLVVELNYEVREPLFGNADVILTFEESFERVLR